MPTPRQIKHIVEELKNSGCDGCRFAPKCQYYLERQQVLSDTHPDPVKLMEVAREFAIMV